MRHLRFEDVTEKNIDDATDVCNQSLRFDSFNPSVLMNLVFQDPNHEQRLAFIAYEGSKPLGFTAGVRLIRQPAEDIDPSSTWIKIIAGIAGK